MEPIEKRLIDFITRFTSGEEYFQFECDLFARYLLEHR